MYFQQDYNPDELYEGQEVDLEIKAFTDLGVKVGINGRYLGMLYHNEVFEELQKGDKRKGYIKKLRPDGKIDVSLKSSNYQANLSSDKELILEMLKKSNGYLPFSDKSNPLEIQRVFKMSKKKFKEAIGGLYKERKIKIERNGIRSL